ncbi:MAG: DNA primase large subunit [Cocleimonas sp.]|jgi:DNA primase large subunit
MSKAETLFREAFERLLANTPVNVPKGTKVSQNNVAKEAGKHPTALKKDRFPTLVLQIQDLLKQQELDSDIIDKKKQLRKQRTLKERLADCKAQRDKLASICEAQTQLIDDLMDQIADFKNGNSKPSYFPEVKN